MNPFKQQQRPRGAHRWLPTLPEAEHLRLPSRKFFARCCFPAQLNSIFKHLLEGVFWLLLVIMSFLWSHSGAFQRGSLLWSRRYSSLVVCDGSKVMGQVAKLLVSCRCTIDQRGMMSMTLQTTFKKRLQINISDSKLILGIIEKGFKLTSSLKTSFGQDEQNIMILIPIS